MKNNNNQPVSNIMRRTNAEPLTLELLKKHVPTVKAGKTAMEELKTETNPTKRQQLHKTRQAAAKAQETLIISALPLIKNVASKEHQRRSAWSSRVSYEDILQEAIAGFIRGLYAFRVDIDIKSPTNYLGQWITTSIRRQIETMDHDFTIPHETIERHRRMKAIYSRLANTLEHEPTDTEFLNALNSPDYAADTSKWGKIQKTPSTKKTLYTQKHIEEMREAAAKTYALQTTTPTEDTENTNNNEGYTLTSTTISIETVDKQDTRNIQTEFFYKAFQTMRIGSTQQSIIARTFGLQPYIEPQTVKEISEETGETQKFIKQVIQDFSTYMPVKGGMFHKLLTELTEDEIESLEFSWLIPIVGEWSKNLKLQQPPETLTRKTK